MTFRNVFMHDHRIGVPMTDETRGSHAEPASIFTGEAGVFPGELVPFSAQHRLNSSGHLYRIIMSITLSRLTHFEIIDTHTSFGRAVILREVIPGRVHLNDLAFLV